MMNRIHSFKTASFTFLAVMSLFLPAPVKAEGTPDACGTGKTLYMAKCSQCHGDLGDGLGVGAEFFNPLPRNFTTGMFKLRSTESGELPTNADLAMAIRNGMPYTGMPPWPGFTEKEVADLVCYVKTFAEDFADTSLHVKPIDIPKAPALTQESVKKGRKLYEDNKCLDCHGNLGYGDGISGPTLKDDYSHPIRPADLSQRWTFRGGHRREDIYRTFMTGLNGTPMPSYAASVAGEDRWALVDYVYSLSPADAPDFASMVSAEAIPGGIDAAKGRDMFKSVKPAFFPVVGQVVEDPRNYFPGVNGVEVRAVYDTAKVALLLTWHDMSAQKEGSNQPMSPLASATPVPVDTSVKNSDAIAVQIPFKAPEGVGKPYFLYGDKRNPVELMFADLAKDTGETFMGSGSMKLVEAPSLFTVTSGYQDGEWWALIIRQRHAEKRFSIEEGAFTPISVSIWDGFNRETGNARGVTSWYSLYLKPAQKESPFVPATKNALIAFALVFGVVWYSRKKLQTK